MNRDDLPDTRRRLASPNPSGTRRKNGGVESKLPQLLTIDELADHLGVGSRHIRRLIAERRVPYLKWGHLIRFDPNEIAAWLDENRRSAFPAS